VVDVNLWRDALGGTGGLECVKGDGVDAQVDVVRVGALGRSAVVKEVVL